VTTSAGVSHIDLEECRRRGVQVANVGETFSNDVADYAVGLLIDALRRITTSDRYVRNGFWVRRGDYPLGTKVLVYFTLLIIWNLVYFIFTSPRFW
jgi:glyoxylate/hydroxypyruvate reductase